MDNRPRKTLTDYMVIGISPALIMAMVGSLLFYLLTVFYQGQYGGRLNFIFAMFVMAIVLIARISMEEGIEYATLFAVPLAIVTMVAMVRFVQIQGPLANYSILINFGLIALIWWSAHKLTWDCTLIDDSEDASGEGLLQGMGFDAETVEHQATEHVESARPEPNESAPEGRRQKQPDSDVPLWWQRMVHRRHRPHTPGVWVVYYAIAALPLFAIGQWLIPAEYVDARASAFRQLVVYVGSALALLLTTSFLGLRRYLRQRKLEMPADMAGVWLGIGTIMILTLLAFCVLLPRPGAAVKISQLPFSFGSPDHNRTHPKALGNDGPEQPQQATRTRQDASRSGPNAPTQQNSKGKQSGASQQQGSTQSGRSQPGQQGQQKQQGNAGSRQSRQSDTSGKSGKSAQASGNQQSCNRSEQASNRQETGSQTSGQKHNDATTRSKDSAGKNQQPGNRDDRSNAKQSDSGEKRQADSQGARQNKPGGEQPRNNQPRGNQQQGKQQQGGQQQGGQQQGGQQQNSDSRQTQENRRSGSRFAKDRQPGQQNSQQQSRSDNNRSSQASSSDSSSVTGVLSKIASGFGTLVKLLFWIALIGIVAYFAWKHWDRVLAALSQLIEDLKNLLARLLGGRRDSDEASAETDAVEQGESFKPFADFSDPFRGGVAPRYSTEQLVRHTFEALEAWGRERGCPRDAEQTPLEFARRLAVDHPNLAVEAQQLADLYSRVAYGHERIGKERRSVLEQLWRYMRNTAAMPPPPVATP